MDFSFLRRWEALLTLAAIGALSSTVTVVLRAPPTVQVGQSQACAEDLAAIRRHLDQLAQERERATADLREYLRPPPRPEPGEGITTDDFLRARRSAE